MTLRSELSFKTISFVNFRQRLLEIEPEIDESTLNDTLEGLTDLHEAIGGIVRSALEDEAMALGLKSRLDELRKRLGRFQDRSTKKRQLARSVMEEAELKKICQPDFTLSLRPANPGVIVTDENAIPETYWVPQPARLDKRAILDDLKRGEQVAGAELANQHLTLSVQTK